MKNVSHLPIKYIVLIKLMKNGQNKPTTLTLNEETKKQLAELGKKGETFDTILQRVIGNSARLCSKNNIKSQEAQENEEEQDEE